MKLHMDVDRSDVGTSIADRSPADARTNILLKQPADSGCDWSSRGALSSTTPVLERASQAIASTQDLQAALLSIMESATHSLGAQGGWLYLLTSDGQMLELAVACHAADPLHGARLHLGEGLAGQVALSGTPRIAHDYVHWEGRARAFAGGPFAHIMGAPLRARQRVVGVMVVGSSAGSRLFTDEDCHLLVLFADHAAIAIENARLHAALSDTSKLLQSAKQAKDEMIHHVSHELRTPLTLLLGYAELLDNEALGPLTQEQKQALDVMRRQGESLQYMVNRLLALQTLDIKAPQRISLELIAWLRQMVGSWMPRAAERGLQLQPKLAPPPVFILAHPDYLGQVVENLLDNAVKFSPRGGLIQVCAEPREGRAVIAVSDQGIGIATDELRHLFERFHQVDGSTTRRFGGMGIGLALCWKIVEAHVGTIWAESPGEGMGSTFFVSLPARLGHEEPHGP